MVAATCGFEAKDLPPQGYAIDLTPSDVKAKGEGWKSLTAKMIFKIRYAFYRTMWRHIHAKAKKYCSLMGTPGILRCGSIVLELLFTTRVDLLHILASVACTKAKTQAISRLIMVRSCTIRFQRMQCLA
jgi:hypothetical protein